MSESPPHAVVALERDVRALGGEPAAVSFDRVRVEAIGHLAARSAGARQRRAARTVPTRAIRMLGPRPVPRSSDAVIGSTPAGGVDRRSRRRRGAPRKRPIGHSSRLRPVARPANRRPRELVEIGHLREVDVGVRRVEPRRRPASAIRAARSRSRTARRPRRASRRRRSPRSRSRVQCKRPDSDGKRYSYDAGQSLVERPGQIVAALEQVKGAVEVAVAGQLPRSLAKKISRIRGNCTRDFTA